MITKKEIAKLERELAKRVPGDMLAMLERTLRALVEHHDSDPTSAEHRELTDMAARSWQIARVLVGMPQPRERPATPIVLSEIVCFDRKANGGPCFCCIDRARGVVTPRAIRRARARRVSR